MSYEINPRMREGLRECYGCEQWDLCVLINNRFWCKPCFDKMGYDYRMMDYVEFNQPHIQAVLNTTNFVEEKIWRDFQRGFRLE